MNENSFNLDMTSKGSCLVNNPLSANLLLMGWVRSPSPSTSLTLSKVLLYHHLVSTIFFPTDPQPEFLLLRLYSVFGFQVPYSHTIRLVSPTEVLLSVEKFLHVVSLTFRPLTDIPSLSTTLNCAHYSVTSLIVVLRPSVMAETISFFLPWSSTWCHLDKTVLDLDVSSVSDDVFSGFLCSSLYGTEEGGKMGGKKRSHRRTGLGWSTFRLCVLGHLTSDVPSR